jgi:hypothetical protein
MEGSTLRLSYTQILSITLDSETPAQRVHKLPNYTVNFKHQFIYEGICVKFVIIVDDENNGESGRRVCTCLTMSAATCQSTKFLNFWRLTVKQP